MIQAQGIREQYRALPSVEKLLAAPVLGSLIEGLCREVVVNLARSVLEEARAAISAGSGAPTLGVLVEGLDRRLRELSRQGPSSVINATGVLIHTNLGRAPLSSMALRAMEETARGYSDLEYMVEEGERGSRQQHLQNILCQLTGAEAALVVNNNAAAVLLALAAIAAGKQVVVSRGEAVEIGGGFRIPDVLRQSGGTLVEVGTTNRTYVRDYEEAITSDTGVLLRIHTSNFRITGFTHAPTTEELVALGDSRGVPLLYDLGSGCLLPTEQFGMAHEPTPQEAITAGVGLVFFSGDKLLGGPQAGIVVGKAQLIARMARHPMARAVRLNKIGLAALSATLLHYLKGEALREIPLWRMLSSTADSLKARADRWQKSVGPMADVCPGQSTVGGGSLPGETLPSWLLSLRADDLSGGADGLAYRLRQGSPPVVARIVDQRVVLDPRSVSSDEEEALLATVRAALAGGDSR